MLPDLEIVDCLKLIDYNPPFGRVGFFENWCAERNLVNHSKSYHARTFVGPEYTYQFYFKTPSWKLHQARTINRHYGKCTVYHIDDDFLFVCRTYVPLISESFNTTKSTQYSIAAGLIACYEKYFQHNIGFDKNTQLVLLNSYAALAKHSGFYDLSQAFLDMMQHIQIDSVCDFKPENFLLDTETNDIILWDVLYN